MATFNDDSQILPQGRGLIGWVRALTARLGSKGDLREIDRAEFDQIARDLNLSAPDLYAISTRNDMTVDLLDKRMADFGLSAEAMKRRHPEVLRDLQRVCGLCSLSKRCRREFAQHTSDAARSSYCPNTPTLQALEQENLTAKTLAALRIGPSCC